MSQIIGAHVMIYSVDAEADRAFFRDVLCLSHVDVGGGWLIFKLPPAELGCHPAEENGLQELSLMCDDLEAFILKMQEHKIACDAVHEAEWGRLTRITLPGGGRLGVYQPLHGRL